jgi:hypothetical protein
MKTIGDWIAFVAVFVVALAIFDWAIDILVELP